MAMFKSWMTRGDYFKTKGIVNCDATAKRLSMMRNQASILDLLTETSLVILACAVPMNWCNGRERRESPNTKG